MRKNKTMRAAGLMLALTLITSCFVGGTFAKYTTSKAGQDSARVAKFGVTIEAQSGLFSKEYAAKETIDGIEKSVVAEQEVVAPGTSGTLTAMTISGTPEVAVEVKYESDFELNGSWKLENETFYCPLVVTVGEKTINGTDYTSASDFKAAVEAEIATCSAKYAPGSDLSAAKAPSISWEWPFEVTGNDTKDTELGNQAAAGNASSIILNITTSVTQID